MELRNQVCAPYANYLKLNLQNELSLIEGTADDMLARLDEFENLLNMVRSESAWCWVRLNDADERDGVVAAMVACIPAVDNVCARVDQLQAVVDRVEKDVTMTEIAVLQAEADLASPSSSHLPSFASFLKPLFTKNTLDDVKVKKLHLPGPSISMGNFFNADDFFSNCDSCEAGVELEPSESLNNE